MDEYTDATYGQRWADAYDGFVADLGTVVTEPTVDKLAELVGDGRLLELAIGTGRIAVPLVQRGIEVHGIDASEEMVARMREKDGGADIPVTIGDMADVAVEGCFDVVALVFNTIFALRTQDAQVRLFRNVAEHLGDDGVFIIECFVPDPLRIAKEQRVEALEVRADRVAVDVVTQDRNSQVIHVQRVDLSEAGIELRPIVLRYAYPAELDLMARLAGLELRDRWGGWADEPFTNDSGRHVSVYARPSS